VNLVVLTGRCHGDTIMRKSYGPNLPLVSPYFVPELARRLVPQVKKSIKAAAGQYLAIRIDRNRSEPIVSVLELLPDPATLHIPSPNGLILTGAKQRLSIWTEGHGKD
jgi:hypothetical protein